MESCGRGHHKRRRKGARQAFFRRKNDERRRQQANKENIVANTPQPTSLTSTTMTLSDLQESMAKVSLPEHWQAFNADGVVQWSRMEIGHGSLLQPTASILLCNSLTWSVHIRGKKVPATCKLLAEFPSLISSPTILSNLIRCVHEAQAILTKFLSLCVRSEEGQWRKEETSLPTWTVRHQMATALWEGLNVIWFLTTWVVVYAACQSFRSTLRSAVHRSSQDNTAVSSHTNYIHLTPDEKNERLKNLHQSLRAAKQQSNRLQSKINQLIESEGIQLQPNDAEDISQIVEDVTPTVIEKVHLKESFGISRGSITDSGTNFRWGGTLLCFVLLLTWSICQLQHTEPFARVASLIYHRRERYQTIRTGFQLIVVFK